MTTNGVYVFGHGGHARVIASLLAPGVIFVDRHIGPDVMAEADFFGSIDALRDDAALYLGVGDNAVRRRLFEQLARHDIVPATLVSNASFVARDAHLGLGVLICPGAVVMAGARVGNNTIVNTHASVDHDCQVGDHAHLSAAVTLGGGTVVGSGCFFGIRSATIPGVSIGDDSIVMAGAVVTRDVPAGMIVGGTPAVVVKRSAQT